MAFTENHTLYTVTAQFLSGRGGGLFLAPLFLLNYFLFNLFLFCKKVGRLEPPSPFLCAVPGTATSTYTESISFSSYIIIVKEGTTTDKGSSLNFTKKYLNVLSTKHFKLQVSKIQYLSRKKNDNTEIKTKAVAVNSF